MPRTILPLAGTWKLRACLDEEWRTVNLVRAVDPDRDPWLPASVPGSVVHDLWRAGEIPDPYRDRNSRFAEWAATRSWIYRRSFTYAPRPGERVRLRLERVDPRATIVVDGRTIAEHDSVANPAVIEIGDVLARPPDSAGEGPWLGDHVLAVVLHPAPVEPSQAGRTSLAREHRGRMWYGWDFCPRLPHQGIWADVRLEMTGPVAVDGVRVEPRLDDDFAAAEVTVEARCSALAPSVADVRICIHREGLLIAERAERRAFAPGVTPVRETLRVDGVDLWWPNGMGDASLYEASVEVRMADGEESDDWRGSFGIRRIELAQNEGAPSDALPYTFTVNGRRVFARGWNWVPADVFPGVPRPGRLERLLELARRAGVNLLRVWGGGVVETEAFYGLCDRRGIMVWQEFLLSSSGEDHEPSAARAYIDRVMQDAELVVPRLANHPSLAAWCGGNELAVGPDRRPLTEAESPVLHALRSVVRQLDPGRAWLPTSPSGRSPLLGADAIERGDTFHDAHGPWHHQGLEGQYALAAVAAPLLHSEFGAAGMSNGATIARTISLDLRWPAALSNPVWRHRGAWWNGEEPVRAAFGRIDDLAMLERASQYLQAEGVRVLVEAARRRWPMCSGTLPWQFDEPYPSAYGTNAVDWSGRPKPVYAAVARAYAPVLVSAQFDRQAWGGREAFSAELWLTAEHAEPFLGRLRARLLAEEGDLLAAIDYPIDALPDGSVDLGRIECSLVAVRDAIFVLDLAIEDDEGVAVATNRYLLSAARDLGPILNLPRVELDARWRPSRNGGGGAVEVRNCGDVLAPLVRLVEPPEVAEAASLVGDDGFTLLPGEAVTVAVAWRCTPEAPGPAIDVVAWNADPIRLACGLEGAITPRRA